MVRFDPNAYPDRLAFHARARQLRSEELDRLAAQLRTWLTHLVAGIAITRVDGAEPVRRASEH